MPMSSLITARLFIRFQVLVGQLLMGLEGSVRVPPEMETERADASHDRHDHTHQDPDRDGHVFACFSVSRSVTNRAGQRLAGGSAEEQTNRDDDSPLHVMMRSRFIFFQNQMP